jgi:DNA-directed RNA polymerase alpha subunit
MKKEEVQACFQLLDELFIVFRDSRTPHINDYLNTIHELREKVRYEADEFIAALDSSLRNKLFRAGIYFVDDFRKMSRKDLRQIDGMGEGSARRLETLLSMCGIQIGSELVTANSEGEK